MNWIALILATVCNLFVFGYLMKHNVFLMWIFIAGTIFTIIAFISDSYKAGRQHEADKKEIRKIFQERIEELKKQK